MGYTRLNLADGERIVYRTKSHRIVFLWPFVFLLASLAALLGGFKIPAGLFLALALLAGVWVFFSYLRSDVAVTNRRVVGRFAVDLIEIRDVEFKPIILGLLFNYGTVVITDRRGARHEFSIVPGEFYKQVEARDARVRRILR